MVFELGLPWHGREEPEEAQMKEERRKMQETEARFKEKRVHG